MDIDVIEWAQSVLGFYVDRTWRDGRWVMGNRPIRLADYHADLLRHVFTPGDDGRLPYDVIAWCEPAKSGKSAIAGLVAEYVGLHGDRNSTVVLASNKQNQAASLMYASFADSVRANPALHVTPGKYETTLANGNTVRAIPSNSRGEAGARFSLALFDELWAYQYTDSERLWSEFKSDPTRTMCLKMATGYAGYLESELWLELLTKGQEGDPVLTHITNDGEPACWANGRQFTFWSHECRQPWQTQAWIESQRAALRPAEFSRMIETRFVEGVGDFVTAGAWEALIDPNHHPLEPGAEQPIFVGLDLALAAKGDDCALIGCYAEDGKVKIAFHQVWKGAERSTPLKLSRTVKPFLLRAAQDYRLAGVFFDPWQAQHLADELRDFGIPCIDVPQTRATRGAKDSTLYEMVQNRELVLYPDDELRTMTAGAHAQELGDGRLFLKKAGRTRIDLLVALSNCADEARSEYVYGGKRALVWRPRRRDPGRRRALFLAAMPKMGEGPFQEWP